MGTERFELTPEHQGLLAALALETGKPVPVLLREALEGLQEHARLHRPLPEVASPPPSSPTREPSVLEIFQEARAGIPDAVWQALPDDLAVQHDHYIYGTPKRTP